MGLFGALKENWQNAPKDERKLMLSAAGDIFLGLGQGRPVGGEAQRALNQRRADRQTRAQLDASGIADMLNPRQRRALAMMPASKALEITAGLLMQPPTQRRTMQDVNGRHRFVDDGSFVFPDATPVPMLTDKEKSVQVFMEQFGVDKPTATKMAYGLIKTNTDPMTREVTQLDTVSGKQWAGIGSSLPTPGFGVPEVVTEVLDPVAVDPAMVASETIETLTQTAPEYGIDPAKAYGVGGVVRSGVNAVGDAIGAGTAFPEVGQIQADVAVLGENMLADIASGYPRQPPSWMLQNIKELTPKAGTLSGIDAQIRKVNALRNSFKTELDTLHRQVARKQSPASKQEIQSKIIAIESAIGRVDAFLQSHQPPSGLSQTDTALIDRWAD